MSGQTWKTYTLRPSGTLEAEYTRGPLIVWATKPSDGEALPDVGTPTPSPLEARALEVNTRAHFEAFVRAVQGYRRTRRAVRKTRAWVTRQFARSHFHMVRLAICRELVAECRALGRPIGEVVPAWAWLDEQSPEMNEAASNLLEAMDKLGRAISSQKAVPGEVLALFKGCMGRFLSYLHKVGHTSAISYILKAFKAKHRSTLVLALRFLEQSAFRAHITRRVRPVSRRPRAPRPLYARPRPPTAPLAPPVT